MMIVLAPLVWLSQFITMHLKKDKDVVLAAVKNEGYAIKFADESFRNNREIIISAVQNDGSALEFAHENLKNDKEVVLDKVCKKYKLIPSQVAYIGDDVNDIGLLKKVGFSASPKDGMPMVKKICNYRCQTDGGKGAFRELAELILKNR